MPVELVDQSSFQREVVESERPVIVDFYADWCAPCRAMAPVLKGLSERRRHVKFVKVDVDENPELARAHGVVSIPAIARFEAGEARRWVLGARPGSELERELGLVDDEEDGDGGGRGALERARRGTP